VSILCLGAALSGCAEASPSDPDYSEGREVYATCAACHGKQGEGGAGPALNDVLITFPDCQDQQRWISLGSAGWKEEVGDTYGATDRPINGAMPRFEESLTSDQIRQAALYERVRFGGVDLETEKEACGLS
jgi:mono/diheme cytochrome c family protein